ncbi:hypothetical protein MMC11_003268 [Xylographa trunciseda]|nr:hypothetical protein [Xylographa trunciseda]
MGDINDVKKDLAGLRMEQSSGLVTTTTAAPSMTEHLEEVRSEIRKTAASIANPVIRAGCERGLFIGLERAFSPSPEAIASTKSSEPIPARYASGGRGNKKVRVVLSRETKKLETFFGSISFHTETANFCIEANLTGKSALSERYEYKTTFRLFPASWLINRGLEYSINLTFRSNYQGWHQCLNIMRAVSGDSLILYACGEDRNLELVRHLITTEQASVRDQGPNGVTPLHVRKGSLVQALRF